jgi:hypothetical protein
MHAISLSMGRLIMNSLSFPSREIMEARRGGPAAVAGVVARGKQPTGNSSLPLAKTAGGPDERRAAKSCCAVRHRLKKARPFWFRRQRDGPARGDGRLHARLLLLGTWWPPNERKRRRFLFLCPKAPAPRSLRQGESARPTGPRQVGWSYRDCFTQQAGLPSKLLAVAAAIQASTTRHSTMV